MNAEQAEREFESVENEVLHEVTASPSTAQYDAVGWTEENGLKLAAVSDEPCDKCGCIWAVHPDAIEPNLKQCFLCSSVDRYWEFQSSLGNFEGDAE